MTASIGVAQWLVGASMQQIYARTDGALYEAKKLGRNRVLLAKGQGFGERIETLMEPVIEAQFRSAERPDCVAERRRVVA